MGVQAALVQVEVHVGKGLPGFEIVGLPEAAVRESRVRVRSALHAAGREMPPRHVIVNLAPADLRKTGSAFDLAIAVGVLAASGHCAPDRLAETLMVGELSLSGELKPIRGVLAFLRTAAERGIRRAIVPTLNAREACLLRALEVKCASTLGEVVEHLDGRHRLFSAGSVASTLPAVAAATHTKDLSEIQGQPLAKRALEIAAAGNHNLLLVGPPGAGKTMLAERLATLLPPPTESEALEIATIASAAPSAHSFSLNMQPTEQIALDGIQRPFRSPHHTASEAALFGGGDPVQPGEVTLAHHGVLFLDELPEFRRGAIEALRVTMETGRAEIARAKHRVSMPAHPLIVGAMNPCPCGYAGHPTRMCSCSPDRVARYKARISGPILDRFDLQLFVPAVTLKALVGTEQEEPSAVVQRRVMAARERQISRPTAGGPSHGNPDRATEGGALPESPSVQRGELWHLSARCETKALAFLHRAFEKLNLSARGYVKVLRVANTIANMENRSMVTMDCMAEALQYRKLDRGPSPTTTPAEANSSSTEPSRMM